MESKSESKKNDVTLSARLIKVIFSCYVVVAFTITTGQLFVEFDNEKGKLKDQIVATGNTFAGTITEAVWNFEEGQIHAALLGLYKNDEIFGARIESKDGDIYSVGFNALEGKDYVFHTPEETELTEPQLDEQLNTFYEIQLPILHAEDGEIGTTIITYSSVTVFERTYSTFVLTIVSAFIKTMALWMLSVYLINKKVAIPLMNLTEKLHSFDVKTTDTVKKDPVERNPEGKKDELDVLYDSFYHMQTELVNKNKLVEEHQINLEEKIEARTEELVRTLEELEKSNQVKSEFLALISHELRTPLNGIIGWSETFSHKMESARDRKFMRIIHSSGLALLNILNDLLDLTKLEANQFELHKEDFDLIQLVEDCFGVFSITSSDKKIAFVCHVAPDVPTSIIGDGRRLKQVIINLLGNAFKFTESGEISLDVQGKIIDQEKEEYELLFEVKDTGIGLDVAKLDTYFDLFTQEDSSLTRAYDGVGMGLPICKRLVELMGGSIGVQSEIGEGSVFWFSFRCRKGELFNKDLLTNPLKGKQLLVLDNQHTYRQFVADACKRWSMVSKTSDDVEGLCEQLSREDRSGNPYDLVLIDMDAVNEEDSILNRINQLGLSKAPITLMSGRLDQFPESSDSGFMTLEKPTSPGALYKTLSSFYC